MVGMPKARHSERLTLPCPPLAWSAMLASRIALYSGVSGACCPKPQGLVWSNDGMPPSPGTTKRVHWPLRSGYFVSSNARALPSASAETASAAAAVRTSWRGMLVLPSVGAGYDSGGAKAAPRLRLMHYVG